MKQFKTILPFLNTERKGSNRLLSYAGLLAGITLLLCTVQMFVNIGKLTGEKNISQDGFEYIPISKTVTNENMRSDNRFNDADIAYIKQQPFITDAAPLISNQFRATISAGNIIPFSTDIFLEAINDGFIDTLPESFHWKRGQGVVPIIFSANFLEIYNVFAPGQDLPQLSEQTLKALRIKLECSGPGGTEEYVAHIVALSDRINSVLVPESFLSYANSIIGLQPHPLAARVFIKTDNAESAEFLSFLNKSGLHINKDRMRLGHIKQIVSVAVSAIGIFAVLVILLSIMSLGFYLKLLVAKSRDNLQLLLVLGYSKRWLIKTISKQWIPIYIITTVCGVALLFVFQILFNTQFSFRKELTPFPSIYVLLLAIIIVLICMAQNRRTIKKLLEDV